MTATATSKARKPRTKPIRKIRLLLEMNEQGMNGIIAITEGKKTDEYFLDRLKTDFGEGFVVTKREYVPNEDEHSYNVCLDGTKSTCTRCKSVRPRLGHTRVWSL